MFWNWLFLRESERPKPAKKHLSRHSNSAFRTLLFGRDFLILIVFGALQWTFPQHSAYNLWLSGLTATLAMLSVFAMGSTRMHGYRRYRDPLGRICHSNHVCTLPCFGHRYSLKSVQAMASL